TQKQNRKQTVKAKVAIYPGKPLTDWKFVLESLDSGEKTVLTKDNPKSNTASIKTRTLLRDDYSSQYFEEFELNFLTKTPYYDKSNPEKKERYKYSIYVKDSKGEEDTKEKEFEVRPDAPPQPVFSIRDTYLREQASNIAKVDTEDITVLSDGDQAQRVWYYRGYNPAEESGAASSWQKISEMPGFTDLLFGKGIKVQFDKEGVGNFDVRLFMKDVWTEETLPEYVSEEDYLSASCTKTSKVENIAPVVSLEPVFFEKLNIDFLIPRKYVTPLNEKLGGVKKEFLDRKIDANLSIAPIKPSYEGPVKSWGSFTTKFGNGGYQFLQKPFADSEYAFIPSADAELEAGRSESSLKNIGPITLTCYKEGESPDSPETVWTYKGGENEVFTAAEDKSERYIFIIGNDLKILSRDTGAIITSLPLPSGGINSSAVFMSNDERLYFVLSDKIMCYELNTGVYRKACDIGGSSATYNAGKISFFGTENIYDGTYYQGVFDLNTEEFKKFAYPSLPKGQAYRFLGQSGDKAFFQGDDNFVYLADFKTQEIKKGMSAISGALKAGVITDASGDSLGIWLGSVKFTNKKNNITSYSSTIQWMLLDENGNFTKSGTDNYYRKQVIPASTYWSPDIFYAKYNEDDDFIYLLHSASVYYDNVNVTPFTMPGYAIRVNPHSGSGTQINMSEALENLSNYNTGSDISGANTLMKYVLSGYRGGHVDTSVFKTFFSETQAKAQAFSEYVTDKVNDLVEYLDDAVVNFEELYERARNKLDSLYTVMVKVDKDKSEGSISKTLDLLPNKEYYYEYEIKPLSTGGAIKVNTSFDFENEEGDNYEEHSPLENQNIKYVVTDEWIEDFNDSYLNKHFTFSSVPKLSGGRWEAIKYEETFKRHRAVGFGGNVTFEIPKGKCAILSFDHAEHDTWRSYGDSNYRESCFERWMLNGKNVAGFYPGGPGGYGSQSAGDISGTYIHGELLTEGKYTVSYSYSNYYDLYNIYQYMDNLRLTFVEPVGDSTYFTNKTGENQKFTAKEAGDYLVRLTGPSSDGYGASVRGKVHLEAGEELDMYLGPQIPKATGARNGLDGQSGNGYGDSGTHKASISSAGIILMTAGGGGQNGNPGTGDGATVSSRSPKMKYKCTNCEKEYTTSNPSGKQCGNRYKRKGTWYTCGSTTYTPICTVCGYVQSDKAAHYHYNCNGTGGTGGKAADAGSSAAVYGEEGSPAIHSGGQSEPGLYTYYYGSAGPGGKGGNAGASYVNEAEVRASAITKSENLGASSCVITKLDGSSPNESYYRTTITSLNGSENWQKVEGKILTPCSELYYSPVSAASSSAISENQRHFVNQEGVTYVLDSTYSARGTFSLSFSGNGGSEFLIRNLKVYYYGSSGRKMYVNETNNDVSEYNRKWKREGVTLTGHIEPKEEKDEHAIVYNKGELIGYGIYYSDYENDPENEAAGEWIYAHTPFNDGPYEKAAIIYDEDGNIASVCGKTAAEIFEAGLCANPVITEEEALVIASKDKKYVLNSYIPRFYVDGKYTVYHRAYDDTSRKTATGQWKKWDRASDFASLTFYIQGGASAPWITHISTDPKTVNEKDKFKIKIGVDDAEKDELSLTTEVYRDKKHIYTHRKKGIKVNEETAQYPYIYTDILPEAAKTGTYEVVATVRDKTGAGLGSYKFIVVSAGNIKGSVYHTDKWNQNRKRFNVINFKNEINYEITFNDYLADKRRPRPRGTNVFWPGEKFMLNAFVRGEPLRVTCSVKGTSFRCTMKDSGKKTADGERIFEGSLFERTMINKWGNDEPEQLYFVFTSEYEGGQSRQYEVPVILDNNPSYLAMHRRF
ncbi:MAG: hypothetical protein K6F52_07810, partial [Clostridia bacterium]|nr:hypothetical protein [Clostridia bacterium]